MVIYATVNGEIKWSAPLILYKYIYGSEMLNNWTGKTIIDKDKNYITTSSFVAGNMNEKNAFNGVILGTIGKITEDNSETKTTGIYGYGNGEQTYAFKEDGTAFIGPASGGRIYFNGTKSIIASKVWFDDNGELKDSLSPGETGLKIDLSTGVFDAPLLEFNTKTFTLNSNNLLISSDGKQIGNNSTAYIILGENQDL
jgi:hypothetical protein